MRRIAILLFLLTLLGTMPARAADALAAELQPVDDEIAQLEALLQELERRGQQRVTQLQRWVQWWTRIKEFYQQTAADMKKDFDERIANAEKAAGTLAGLSGHTPPNQRHVPHYGWHDAVSMAKFLYNLKQEYGKAAELAAKLKSEWHIAAVGWITGEGIQRIIAETEKQIRDANQCIRDGECEIHVAGYGWTRGAWARKRIADLQKRRQELRDQVSRGDYEVHIPGLGLRTRKKLDAEIAAVEVELQKRRDTLAKGELTIHRPAFDWKSKTKLQAELDADEKAFEAMKKTVADGIYGVWLVETGWAKRVELEARVKGLEETLAKTKDALAKGNYRAQLPAGWSTANELRKMLEELGKQSGQKNLDAKAREAIAKQIEVAQKSLAELQAVSAFDLLILAMEKAKFSMLITGMMKHARPDFERRELVRTEKSEGLPEYPIEGAIWIKPVEDQLARLKAARQWIPGGS